MRRTFNLGDRVSVRVSKTIKYGVVQGWNVVAEHGYRRWIVKLDNGKTRTYLPSALRLVSEESKGR